MVSLRRHFVPNPVQSHYCTTRSAKNRRSLSIHTRYDQASSRLFRQDVKAGGGFDEGYGYDGAHRLTAAARGTLSGGTGPITSPVLQQSWNLDSTGNWPGFSNFDQNTAANTLVQQRTSNTSNEITNIARTVGAAWATPGYDRNGNMTTIPQPAAPTSTWPGTYDAWNRLVFLNYAEMLYEFLYDGLNRRTTLVTGGDTRNFYYNDQWQVLEERLNSGSVPDRQYVWGIRYVDDIVLRDRSVSDETLNERFYALQDANWNVVAICDPTGAVQERYAYTPYGVCQFLSSLFVVQPDGSAFDWNVLYTGRTLDPSGLYYYRRRYYHPLIGVLIGRDPIGYASGANLYKYVDNGPCTFVDPFGLVRASQAAYQCNADQECKCDEQDVLDRGDISLRLRAIYSQQGVAYFGGAHQIDWGALGTGDPTKCKFRRYVLDYVHDNRGTRTFDKDFKRDGPAMMPPATEITRGPNWTFLDHDAPALLVPRNLLPASKQALYVDFVVNSDGTISQKCCSLIFVAVGIDTNGKEGVKVGIDHWRKLCLAIATELAAGRDVSWEATQNAIEDWD